MSAKNKGEKKSNKKNKKLGGIYHEVETTWRLSSIKAVSSRGDNKVWNSFARSGKGKATVCRGY